MRDCQSARADGWINFTQQNAVWSGAAGGDSTSGKPSVLLEEIYSTARSRGLAIILRIEEEKATSRAERVSATAIP